MKGSAVRIRASASSPRAVSDASAVDTNPSSTYIWRTPSASRARSIASPAGSRDSASASANTCVYVLEATATELPVRAQPLRATDLRARVAKRTNDVGRTAARSPHPLPVQPAERSGHASCPSRTRPRALPVRTRRRDHLRPERPPPIATRQGRAEAAAEVRRSEAARSSSIRSASAWAHSVPASISGNAISQSAKCQAPEL